MFRNKTSYEENVNFDEVKIFDDSCRDFYKKTGMYFFLYKINTLRLKFISNCCNGFFGKKILDIGCGGGILTESMFKKGGIVTGIDVSKKMLKVARLQAIEKKMKIKYLLETAEQHSKNNAHKYDIITCMEVLEHVPKPKSIVLSCDKLIKKGGHVFFSTINRNIKSWISLIFFAEKVLNIFPRNTHKINKFILPCELLGWIDQTNMREKHITGLGYNFFLNKFYFRKSLDINYIIHVVSY
ncbi:bifunctional 2-polyprenyl-6-hydroxyphenol methylase/3-demethylubiquinol 3-O-methyltransferase UbiG [Candidatus Riesia pediculischaeffi]|uniref:3-demethylubiquinone-9 3-methyltransferase n=1 Tax=Candidatus Riesia pediculischaeffi PTSU TaxID=1401651 RepID=A0A0C1V6E3_9ENTR|nr:bifunctional 2-polyprenyl-6-hydroxyphenol methylase/3-demethylubiquinol 3-O-methyltransferase UbiG [Candidatus Riesia pediculischaeffi]KIE64014.1 3-demethylubiquinone-9 3-methyltransferase [Candidatus Riesia pediculischaeffi PTSU]